MSIKDLHPREPIGACVTIGVKDSQRGFPTGTDRWYIVNPREDAGVRALHPSFTGFNSAPPEARKVLRGNIMHSRMKDCFEYNLKAQVLPGHKGHPDKRPACVGDGVHARRWEGPGPDDFFDIKCPNERCEFRHTTPPACKPFARFLFRLRWKDESPLPTPLVKFTTGSWNTVANLVGFFEYLSNDDPENPGIVQQLGIQDNYSLFGFPFVLTLQYQTKASAKSKFPVVHISPECDPVQFFMRQRGDIALIQGARPIALPDPEQQDNSLVYEDVQSISVPTTKE